MLGENPATRKITYGGRDFVLEHFFPNDVTVLEGGNFGRFQEINLLEEIASRDLEGTYLDCGANIGNHSVFFLWLDQCKYLVSVEAHPKIADVLLRNLQRNFPASSANVSTIVNAALWRPGKESCHLGPIPHNNSGRTKVYTGTGPFTPHKDIEVPCMTIDTIWAGLPEEHRDVVVLKMDIEDSEIPAIEGARRMIESERPLIIAEHHTSAHLKGFQDIVSEYGYTLNDDVFDPRGETRIWEPSS